MNSFIFLMIAACFFSSCRITKTPIYFKTLEKDTTINALVNKDLETKIRPRDQLGIAISSSSRLEDDAFNAVATSASPGYAVDLEGNIQMHKLGFIKVEGMTRKELKLKLQKDLEPYLKDPVVTVTYLNRRITVLGQVMRPGVVLLPDEQMAFLEVLALSGEMTALASRDNVLIIRDTKNGKQFKRINLEDHSLFNVSSPWYYLQSDDIVYVEPNAEKIDREARWQRNQMYLTTLTAGLSIFILVVDRLLR